MELSDYIAMLLAELEKSEQGPTKTTIFLDEKGGVLSATVEYT